MKLYVLTAVMALFLAGCGQQPEAPADGSPRKPDAGVRDETPVIGPERQVLAFGDSLLAGYGLKPGESYPAKLEAALRARGINARIANAGVSGDTTAAALQRLEFTLSSQARPPELVLISLGGNDMLRGLPPQQTRDNLDAMLTALDKRGSKVVLLGMLAPPNLGADYRGEFDPIYPALAKKHGAALVPFFLQAVTGKPDLVQQDRMHPTARGIEEMVAATADVVVQALPPVTVASPPRR